MFSKKKQVSRTRNYQLTGVKKMRVEITHSLNTYRSYSFVLAFNIKIKTFNMSDDDIIRYYYKSL